MSNISELLEQIKQNKEIAKSEDGNDLALEFNKLYPTAIVNAVFENDKNRIRIETRIFNTSEGSEQIFYYHPYGRGLVNFSKLCNVLQVTQGKTSELVGKFCLASLVQNGDFINLQVSGLLEQKEFEELVDEVAKKEEQIMNMFVPVDNNDEGIGLPF